MILYHLLSLRIFLISYLDAQDQLWVTTRGQLHPSEANHSAISPKATWSLVTRLGPKARPSTSVGFRPESMLNLMLNVMPTY